jgi:hypothetical protein
MLLDVGSARRRCEYHRLLDGTSRTAISGCGLALAPFDGARFRATVFLFVAILFVTSDCR